MDGPYHLIQVAMLAAQFKAPVSIQLYNNLTLVLVCTDYQIYVNDLNPSPDQFVNFRFDN